MKRLIITFGLSLALATPGYAINLLLPNKRINQGAGDGMATFAIGRTLVNDGNDATLPEPIVCAHATWNQHASSMLSHTDLFSSAECGTGRAMVQISADARATTPMGVANVLPLVDTTGQMITAGYVDFVPWWNTIAAHGALRQQGRTRYEVQAHASQPPQPGDEILTGVFDVLLTHVIYGSAGLSTSTFLEDEIEGFIASLEDFIDAGLGTPAELIDAINELEAAQTLLEELDPFFANNDFFAQISASTVEGEYFGIGAGWWIDANLSDRDGVNHHVIVTGEQINQHFICQEETEVGNTHDVNVRVDGDSWARSGTAMSTINLIYSVHDVAAWFFVDDEE